MQIGMIGLGRMGMNMTRRLLRGGHEMIAFDLDSKRVETVSGEGAVGANSLEDLIARLAPPRVAWMMLPIGKPSENTVRALSTLLEKGDILVDGGNTRYRDDLERAAVLEKRGIRYLDAGVSGGIWGLEVGYCTMVGGAREDFEYVEPALATLAPEGGYLYCGETGAGHFVKMVHNGIEYALMEAYGEGFELLRASPYGRDLDLGAVAHLWNRGSVIRSWLLELLEAAFAKDPDLASIRGYVEDSGEGRWTVQEAVEFGVSAGVIALSLFKRFQSRQEDVFSDKVLAALRNEFGGHAVVSGDAPERSGGAGAGKVRPARPDERGEP